MHTLVSFSSPLKWPLVALAMVAVLLRSGLGTPVIAQDPDPGTLLFVKDVRVAFANVGGPKRLPFAVVDIVDGYDRSVNDALVVGDWSGCFRQRVDSAFTERVCWTEDGTEYCVDGQATIWADKTYSCWGKKQACYFVFTITGVFKDGMTYVPVDGYGTSWASVLCR